MKQPVECSTTAWTAGRHLRHGDSSASGCAVIVGYDNRIGNVSLALESLIASTALN
jgi:hypothetical protein